MANFQNIRYQFEPLRSIAFGDISATYSPVGNLTEFPLLQYKVQNLTDANIIYSLDGISEADIIPAMSGYVSDVNSNKNQTVGLWIPRGIHFYVKSVGGNPTTGSVYITASFAFGRPN